MRSFNQYQEYLAEASGPSGAEYESIITVGYNQPAFASSYTSKNAKDKAAYNKVSKWLKKAQYREEARALGKTFRGITSGVMHQHGASKDGTSGLWKTYAQKSLDTPKTDMYTKTHNISLKKKGGSQLMSAAPKESIATIMGALEMSGMNSGVIKGIVDDIEENFTKLTMKGSIEALFNAEKDKKGSFTNMSATEREKLMVKKLKIDEMHKELGGKINGILQKPRYKAIKENVCYIATTGYKKFPEGSRGIANKLIEFDPVSGNITHNIDTGLDGIPSSDMKSMAAATSFYCAFKTGKKNPYSTLRTKTGKFESIQTLNGLMIETLKENLNVPTLLNENVLTESEIIEGLLSKGIEKIKKIGQSFKDWFSHIISKVVEGAKKVFQKIVSLGKRAFEALFDFLGLIITNAKIRVKGVAGGFAAK
jgi:hypothetical protein